MGADAMGAFSQYPGQSLHAVRGGQKSAAREATFGSVEGPETTT
jgi:hypothetical protein